MLENDNDHCDVPVQNSQPTRALEDFAEDINRAYRKSIDNVFEIALLCAQADAAWPKSRKAIIHLLEMDGSNFSRYSNIGGMLDRLLPCKDKLPACFSTVYELTHLDDATFARELQSGKIHPEMTREAAKALRPRKRRKSGAGPSHLSFKLALNDQIHQSPEFEAWLEEGRQKFGVKVLKPDGTL